ncbi:MAG: methyltransferase [Pseudomonadota bacterium]|nr:methyltransferase [Pseudomonadota bacterium]
MPGRVTENAFLGGKIRIRQPKSGWRAGMDAVFLAAAAPAQASQTVLDVGTGVGTAALCLLARVPGVRVTGLELQPDLADLARENAVLNGMEAFFRVETGDIADPPPSIAGLIFDHVITNPPFGEKGTEVHSPLKQKALANQESAISLEDWVRFCRRCLKPNGLLTMIHRADRLDAILGSLGKGFGGIAVFPLRSRQGDEAGRILVQARKGGRSPARLPAGLVLHQPDGRPTPETEAILRHGQPLRL